MYNGSTGIRCPFVLLVSDGLLCYWYLIPSVLLVSDGLLYYWYLMAASDTSSTEDIRYQ
jgi:hypothetical protein